MFARFKDQKGYPVIVNINHVVTVGQAATVDANKNVTVAIGKTAIAMVNGQVITIDGGPDEVYGALRRAEPGALRMAAVREIDGRHDS
jgi:hypothetical protein